MALVNTLNILPVVCISVAKIEDCLVGYILLARVEPAADMSSPFVVQNVG